MKPRGRFAFSHLSVLLPLLLLLLWGCESRDAKIARHRERGSTYLAEGNGQGAIVEFRNLVTLAPDSPEAHFLLANGYSIARKYGAALQAYEEARQSGMVGYELHVKTAEAALYAGEIDQAETEANIALENRRDDTRVYFVLSMVRSVKGNGAGAREFLEKSLELDPDFVPALLTKGKILLGQNQPALARPLFEKVKTLKPKELHAYLGVAESYEQTGQAAEALSQVTAAVAADSDFIAGHLKLGELYVKEQKFDDALAAGEKALALSPKEPEAHLVIGAAALGKGDYDRAETALLHVTKTYPASPLPYFLLSQAYYHKGRFQQAISMASRVLEENATHAGANLVAGASALAADWPDEAVPFFEAAVQSQPNNLYALNLLGAAYLKLDRMSDALATYEKALLLDPQDRTTRESLAYFYGAAGEFEKAVDEYKAAVRLNPDARDTRMRLILGYLMNGDFRNAIVEGEAALEQWPENPGILTLLAEAHGALEEREKALAYFNRAITSDRKVFSSYLAKAKRLAAWQLTDDAIATLEKAVQELPKESLAWVYLGQLYVKAGERASAIETYESALSIDGDLAEALLPLAQLYLAEGSDDKAAGKVHLLLQHHPDMGSAHLLQGKILRAKKEYAAATQSLGQAIDLMPESADALYQRGLARFAQGDYSGALADCRQAAKLAPERIDIATSIAMAEGKLGNLAQAVEVLKNLMVRFPDNVCIHIILGEVYIMFQKWTQAESAMVQGIETGCSNARAYTMLASLYIWTNRFDRAEKTYLEALNTHAELEDALMGLALLYQRRGDRAQAIAFYERTIAVHGENAVAMNNLAWLYAEERRKLDEALHLARKSAELSPQEAGYLDTLGFVHYCLEQYEEAETAWTRALGLSPGNPVIQTHLGQVYGKLGDGNRARDYLEKALKSGDDFPNRQEAKEALDALRDG